MSRVTRLPPPSPPDPPKLAFRARLGRIRRRCGMPKPRVVRLRGIGGAPIDGRVARRRIDSATATVSFGEDVIGSPAVRSGRAVRALCACYSGRSCSRHRVGTGAREIRPPLKRCSDRVDTHAGGRCSVRKDGGLRQGIRVSASPGSLFVCARRAPSRIVAAAGATALRAVRTRSSRRRFRPEPLEEATRSTNAGPKLPVDPWRSAMIPARWNSLWSAVRTLSILPTDRSLIRPGRTALIVCP
jgi:hypothetical protein